MEVTPSFGVVGMGRLGCSLATALVEQGFRVVAIAGRDHAEAEKFASRLGDGVAAVADGAAVAAFADVVILTVQDALIAGVVESIQWQPRHSVVHCSGALGLDVLGQASKAGASVGCLHPLQSFPSRDADASRFVGIACGLEGDERVAAILLEVIRRIGARAVRLEGVDRALYHAAAVFAGNDVVALMSYAVRAWEHAGLAGHDARVALAPLLLGAAMNVQNFELARALTGPVARGDAATVERHIQALAVDPALQDIYRQLGAELLRIARIADPAARNRIQQLLTDAEMSS